MAATRRLLVPIGAILTAMPARRAGSSCEPDGPLTLAELYTLVDGGETEPDHRSLADRSAFGFGRALDA